MAVLLTEYHPRPALTAKVTTIAKPRFSVIDSHNHSDPVAVPDQGRWFIYGLFLPDDVLEQLYFLNARQVLNLSLKE